MRFSARLAASKGSRSLILEDAPRKARVGFIKGILGDFLVSQSNGYGMRKSTLDAQDTHAAFIALIRDESDPWDYDNSSSWAALTEHLKTADWPEFYDFVELFGRLLAEKDNASAFDETEYFKSYSTKVNALFQEDGIGWTLNERSELVRQIPRLAAARAKEAEGALTDKFEPARAHYQKATSYLFQHPIDEANSIKEIVSAVESVAKVVAPKTATLGDAIKALRKDARFSSHMLDALEKVYGYSNATPQVRHGHAKAGRPRLREAELAHAVGVAFILYIIATSRADA
jgi:hypothetical protein